MRVALLTDGIYPYIVGGMQKHSYNLCKYLARSGVKVDLYYTLKNRSTDIAFQEIFTESEREMITPYIVEYPTGPYFPGHYIWKSYEYSKNVYYKLKHNLEKYDLIYIQGFSGWKLLKIKTRVPKANVPIILNFHGLEMFQTPAGFKSGIEQYMFKPFVRSQLRMADFVHSLGGNLTSILVSQDVERNRIVEWPNAIESGTVREEVGNVATHRRFAFVGRYERRKGIQELHEVVRSLIQENYQFEIHFVGPIPAEIQIKDARVVYHGLVENDKIMDVLDEVDYLLVPSYSEGMPTVILEAMARSCAVIASNVGAVNMQVTSENGYLVKAGDVVGLATAIKSAIESSDLKIAKQKKSSLRQVSRFLWENVIREMLSGFDQIVQKRKSEQAF